MSTCRLVDLSTIHPLDLHQLLLPQRELTTQQLHLPQVPLSRKEILILRVRLRRPAPTT
jgi:hypothetical protein